MTTDGKPDVPAGAAGAGAAAAGTRDVLEYESPAAAESIKNRVRRRLLEGLVVLAIIAVLIAILLPTLPGGKRVPAIETANKSQAAQYMAALTRHFAERGTYPAKLDDLVPNYLPALPPVTKKTKWSYRSLSNGSAYELGWTMSRYTWKYDSISDKVAERAVRGQ